MLVGCSGLHLIPRRQRSPKRNQFIGRHFLAFAASIMARKKQQFRFEVTGNRGGDQLRHRDRREELFKNSVNMKEAGGAGFSSAGATFGMSVIVCRNSSTKVA